MNPMNVFLGKKATYEVVDMWFLGGLLFVCLFVSEELCHFTCFFLLNSLHLKIKRSLLV